MRPGKYVQNVLIGAAAVLVAGVRYVPGHEKSGPVVTAAVELVTGKPADSSATAADPLAVETKTALSALTSSVHKLSHPQALEDAFRSYFAYKAAHPAEVKKPYLYFVDYGLPSTSERGYVFDMSSLTLVDGPFTVAHGRGSSTSQFGVPTRFSNNSGAATTSLGLYVARNLYSFVGHAAGRTYKSIGLRLDGVSGNFNDNAMARGVVAHGAPYVTATKAGRSQGCPALEPERAQRLLPKIAEGGLVFLFAPDAKWMANDPWLNAAEG